MKTLIRNSVLLSILLFLFLLSRDRLPLTAGILCLALWQMKTRDRSWILVAVLLAGMMIPRASAKMPNLQMGSVISVRSRYVIVQKGRERLLLYTEMQPVYDSVISFDGSCEKIESTPGFFRSDFAKYCNSRGIFYAITPERIQVVSKSHSLRGALQQAIAEHQPLEEQDDLKRILLGISSTDSSFTSFLNDSGFSKSGILILADQIMKPQMERRRRKKISAFLCFLLCILYHFPQVLVQSLLYRLLGCTRIKPRAYVGIVLTIVEILYPECITGASFLIPASFRLCRMLFPEHPKSSSFFSGMCIQSLLFHTVNPAEMILYPILLPLLGLLWMLALLQLIHLPGLAAVHFMDRLLSCLNLARMPGSILGLGLPFFLLMLRSVHSSRHAWSWAISFFLIFQCFGLFHPFAEVTFLNVGQGDSILVRAPLNRDNVLIDTGKPSQWKNLDSFLESRGIRRIQTLFITHSDSDHSGNLDPLSDKYRPKQIILRHQKETRSRMLFFADLSDLVNEDENESSLTQAFQLNGIRYLCTGDLTQRGEEALIANYGNLRIDVLKLSHHGSKTGTSEALLNTARPALAIVSSGAYSIYHHPSSETIQKLLQRHICYLLTREEGDITIFCLPGINLAITASGRIFLLSR